MLETIQRELSPQVAGKKQIKSNFIMNWAGKALQIDANSTASPITIK